MLRLHCAGVMMNVPELRTHYSAQTFNIIKAFISLFVLMDAVSSLRLTNMSAPLIADAREDMHLDCHFDMGAEVLYAVKWYKDDQEFFRYMPHQQPHMITFPVAGVHMSPQATSCGESRCKVRLTNLTRDHSGGSYRCEVSSEAPAFRLASETHNVTVAALPLESPRITGLVDSYAVGDVLTAECTSGPADPIPALVWYINNQFASGDLLGETSSSPANKQGLSSRTQALRFRIEKKYLQGSVMHLRCECSLPAIPMQPQSVGHTIIVRMQPPLVNNEKLHWPNSSSLPKGYTFGIVFMLLLLGGRWRHYHFYTF